VTSVANIHRSGVQVDCKQVEAAITRALDFLAQHQLAYGEFKTYAASDKLLKRNVHFDSSPFGTAWIVDCLASWTGTPVRNMTNRAMRFLRREAEGPGLWRYWSSHNKNHEFLPPDVDDTCCISALLCGRHEPTLRNRKFILANRNNEGLFFTWMVPREGSPKRIRNEVQALIDPGAWAVWSVQGILDNIDPGVNANALFYLGESASTRAVVGYLIDVVCGKRMPEGVSFYPNALTLYYLVSRAYAGGVTGLGMIRNAIIEKVLERQNQSGAFGNELITAFGVNTLLNFEWRGPEMERAIKALLKMQQDDGGWRGIAAFLGPAPYYGSAELTTAACMQALAKYYRIAD
jgi:hypothetical protein